MYINLLKQSLGLGLLASALLLALYEGGLLPAQDVRSPWTWLLILLVMVGNYRLQDYLISKEERALEDYCNDKYED